jgi:hypothetical protein
MWKSRRGSCGKDVKLLNRVVWKREEEKEILKWERKCLITATDVTRIICTKEKKEVYLSFRVLPKKDEREREEWKYMRRRV